MSLPATEIAIMPLKAGSTIEDPSSSAGQTFQYMLTNVSQQEGFQRAFWGRRIENASEVQVLIGKCCPFLLPLKRRADMLTVGTDWDSIESHKKFIASDGYGSFMERIGTIMDGTASINHACFEPLSPATGASPFSAPVTEFVTFYLPSSTSSEEKATFHDRMVELGKVIQQHAKGFRGTSSGWIVEEVEHASVGTGLGYAAAVGWDSVEAHQAFRETDEFKNAMGKVGAGVKGAVMYHVKFQEG